jgi:hypothetical protein
VIQKHKAVDGEHLRKVDHQRLIVPIFAQCNA